MKKTGIILLVGLLGLVALYPTVSAQDSGVGVNWDKVTVSLANQGLQVKEEIKVTNQDQGNATLLRFWFQQDAQDVKIIADQSGKELIPLITGNIRTCNLTEVNLTIQPGAVFDIQVTYLLPTATQYFEISLLYKTTLLTVTYQESSHQQELFHGEQLLADSQNTLRVLLHKPTEASLDISIIVIVFLIVVIVLASLLLLLKKQRAKTKKSQVESKETLTIKKTLLLSLLTDLEKQYRAQAISNETYTKVKDEYKAQAVNVMKQLDDQKK